MRRVSPLMAAAAAAVGVLTVTSATTASAAPSTTGGASAATQEAAADFVVLWTDGTTEAQARAAIEAAGGTVVAADARIGYSTATSASGSFVRDVAASPAVAGAAHDKPVAYVPEAAPSGEADLQEVERLTAEREAAKGTATAGGKGKPGKPGKPGHGAPVAAEPLGSLQWDMALIHATPEGSYAKQRGDKRVKVAIIDTGVDGTHPDIAPNFDAVNSRNFVTDIPTDPNGAELDGPCEHPSCVDPVDEDDDGHGTHVAGTIGAALNGTGIAGVAPDVTLLNVRAGQDSGYFFLEPTLQALTYVGDAGVDVVNMSYYVDPWLFNCGPANPALDPTTGEPSDSVAEQIEQQTIIEATQRAADYARRRGVTLVAAEGNGHTDLGEPESDDSSPDYPLDTARDRIITNSCLNVPTELDGVIGVTSVGPSTRKAYYSDYGLEQADVAAPGGDYYDPTFGVRNVRNLILSPYPANVAEANGDLDPDGTPNSPFVVQDCTGGTCGYYQYLQGTSMASPHAAGVAALIVSAYGHRERGHGGGLTLNPRTVERLLYRSATPTPCPDPATFVYPAPLTATYTATCEGTTDRNGFYGNGIVDALAAVSLRGGH